MLRAPRRRLGPAGGLGFLLLFGLWSLLRWWPLPERLDLGGSTTVLFGDGSVAHVFLSPDEKWRVPVRVEDVDPAYIDALLSVEDARFRWHPGVDPIALGRAALQNLVAGRVVSGASTLSMQLARLCHPRPRRLASKVLEAGRALQLEVRLSKDELLGAYLTHVPYGRNLEGVEAASLAYFGHSADALQPAEIATLIAVPQDPNHRFPSPANAERLRLARDEVATRLVAAGIFEDRPALLEEILATPVPTALRPQPRQAVHAARWMRGRSGGWTIETTLDRGVQSLVERILAEQRGRAQRQGIENAGIVVADWRTGELRALVGGFDFWADRDGAQIPSFIVPRSPGSTLKPLLYARAVERGLVLPETLVSDVPMAWGNYRPVNFDGQWSGLVRLEEALSRSLNMPFVRLLAAMGVERFISDLDTLGVRSLRRDPGRYGLSLVVGGVELSPLELAGIYTAIADGGRSRPLHWRPDASPPPAVQALAPGAAWLSRRALRLRDRPDFPSRQSLAAMPRNIHWKTGTSFGFRDAWAVGSGGRYTVVVWLGNLNNRGTVHLVGAEAAAPLLFDILEGLDDGLKGEADPMPDDLGLVEVCALSGRVPTEACRERRRAPALRSRVPTATCPYHREIEVDRATGLRVGPGCRDGRVVERRVVVELPAEVRRWLRAPWSAEGPPPWAPGCGGGEGSGPKISSPAPGAVALLIPGLSPTEQEVPMEADSGASSAALSWFVDGAFLGTAASAERVWWAPSVGVHEIVVMDEAGRSDHRSLVVRAP